MMNQRNRATVMAKTGPPANRRQRSANAIILTERGQSAGHLEAAAPSRLAVANGQTIPDQIRQIGQIVSGQTGMN